MATQSRNAIAYGGSELKDPTLPRGSHLVKGHGHPCMQGSKDLGMRFTQSRDVGAYRPSDLRDFAIAT